MSGNFTILAFILGLNYENTAKRCVAASVKRESCVTSQKRMCVTHCVYYQRIGILIHKHWMPYSAIELMTFCTLAKAFSHGAFSVDCDTSTVTNIK